jgi:hypothetical protein
MIVLDPNVKDMYFRHEWPDEKYTACMRQLEEVVSWVIVTVCGHFTDDSCQFDSYYVAPTVTEDTTSGELIIPTYIQC